MAWDLPCVSLESFYIQVPVVITGVVPESYWNVIGVPGLDVKMKVRNDMQMRLLSFKYIKIYY